jgi:hypothetical protein
MKTKNMGIMEIEAEIKEIRELLSILNRKMDVLIGEREMFSVMKLAEGSLKEFLDDEPDLYSLKDLKVRYP